jgi:uridine phosphorylase
MNRMNEWCDTGDDSRLVISPRDYVASRGLSGADTIAERLIMFETGAAIPHITGTYPVEEYPFHLPGFLGNPPVYVLGGENDVALVQGGYGAPAAACNLEAAIELGCRMLFIFGQCGGVGRGLQVGDLVIPTEVVREEGTSFHYTSDDENARPDARLLSALGDFLESNTEHGFVVHTGQTVTTDAAYRQTVKKELRWREEGILGVEMELSALLTVARYRAIPAVGLLVVSDKHDLDGNSRWTWGDDNFRERRLRAIDLLIEFARGLHLAEEKR